MRKLAIQVHLFEHTEVFSSLISIDHNFFTRCGPAVSSNVSMRAAAARFARLATSAPRVLWLPLPRETDNARGSFPNSTQPSSWAWIYPKMFELIPLRKVRSPPLILITIFSFRETACSLLTNSDYFLNEDFTRNKPDLLEKIHRFNAPVRHIIPKQSKSDLKFPTSTSKIQLTNPQGKRNKHQKVNAANRSGLQ